MNVEDLSEIDSDPSHKLILIRSTLADQVKLYDGVFLYELHFLIVVENLSGEINLLIKRHSVLFSLMTSAND